MCRCSGHQDVAEDVKAVTLTELFEGGQDDRSGVVVVEIGTPAVTA